MDADPPTPGSPRMPLVDTMATAMPLLSNVIFLSESGSDGRGFGDISLNQGTDSQSIATASGAAIAAGQGVGFATAGSIGNISIVGTSGVTLMSMASPATVRDRNTVATVGGLFFMAGDNNGPADGGSAGKNTAGVEIESLTIELNLSADGTFGAANIVGRSLHGQFRCFGDGWSVCEWSGTARIWLTTSVTVELIGTIGLITLDDIAVTNTSGLIDAPRHITVAGDPDALANAAVIIADVGGEVKHLTRRRADHDAQSQLQILPSPSSMAARENEAEIDLFRE